MKELEADFPLADQSGGPTAWASQAPVARSADTDSIRTYTGPSLRLPVLVVEDSASLRSALTRVLSNAGYEPISADDGYQAMQVIRTRVLAAAIVDRRIPGPDGIELLAELQTRQPDALRVLVSGDLDLGTTMAAINHCHVDHVFQKPVRYDVMLDQIKVSLDRLVELEASHRRRTSTKDLVERDQLAQCFDEDLLELALQPIVDPRTGAPRAYEALLRSRHQVLSNPGLVISAAERSGRIEDLTRLVAKQAAGWFERLPDETQVFLNLHPWDLEQPDVLLESLDVLQSQAHRVILEITERSALGKAWKESLPRLRKAGFRIAVDDAGAGYSSLSTIAEAVPEVIKVDMSIIRDIEQHPPRQLLLHMLSAFAEDSGVQLIAEGVETRAEADCVMQRAANVWVQGYYYARPTCWKDWATLAL